MLRIKHPGAITRDREKKVSDWETVRTYKYANGVELQILVGFLPHGHAQSALSANRTFDLAREGDDLALTFRDEQATMVNFANGDRPTALSDNTQVLDSCHFVPTAKVALSKGGDAGQTEGEVTTFGDGTTVSLSPHGGHAHVEAKLGDEQVKTFYNGKDNTLYVFDVLPEWAKRHDHDHGHDHDHDHAH